MEINLFLYSLLFIIGASVGSFLNVLIDRLPRGEQIFKGRSYCDHCHHKLFWPDLIPIFSWVVLRGCCRYCRKPISEYYPTVELLTGILFISAVFLLPSQNYELRIMNYELWGWITLPYYLFITSALIVIFFADLKYQIIPDQVIYPTILISLFFSIFNFQFSIFNYLFSSLAAGLFFFSTVLITRGRGMGVGDVKLAVLMGLILGFPNIVVALYLAFLTGAFFGVILILWGKKKFGEHIPFGPFLTASTVVSFWWGENLWQIFQKILGLL